MPWFPASLSVVLTNARSSRKETPQGEKYLNIQIFYFYIRCTRCSAEVRRPT